MTRFEKAMDLLFDYCRDNSCYIDTVRRLKEALGLKRLSEITEEHTEGIVGFLGNLGVFLEGADDEEA